MCFISLLFDPLSFIFLLYPPYNQKKNEHPTLCLLMEGLQRRFQTNKTPNPEDESDYLDEQGSI